jgi:hypothetical protein
MASRRWPSAMPASTKVSPLSGPRCAIDAFIRDRICRASGPGWVKPAIPHIGLLPPDWLGPSRGRRVLNHIPHLVRGFAARFKIGAHLHLGHHAQQDE